MKLKIPLLAFLFISLLFNLSSCDKKQSQSGATSNEQSQNAAQAELATKKENPNIIECCVQSCRDTILIRKHAVARFWPGTMFGYRISRDAHRKSAAIFELVREHKSRHFREENLRRPGDFRGNLFDRKIKCA